jgi:transcription initiation factor TFIIIB Brf1 subunit/transcription initiation factor TFIIB
MDCNHIFIDELDLMTCLNCGLEKENKYMRALETDLKKISNYSAKTSNEDLNYLLEDVDSEIKSRIISTFDLLLKKNNLRGNGKKALLAACYFYISSSSSVLICKDVYKKFGIDKKKFSEGKQLFLTFFPDYRTLEKKISEYVELIFNKFEFPIEKKTRAIHLCRKIDGDVKLSNFNPYAVCACIIYHELLDIGIKKNIFIKKIGMSEMTVQKIMACLKSMNLS